MHKHATPVLIMNSTSSQQNRIKLRAIVTAFDLSPSSIAEATGVSRPYVARLLSQADDFCGSPQFWLSLERNLGKVIEVRRGQVFEVAALSVEQVGVLKSVA